MKAKEEQQKDAKKDEGNELVGPKQRLEVVKITRCKMRAKDTLEIEIGLKTISKKKKQFEQRKFILKFLDKLDPQLACKGRIILSGTDLMNLQTMQFGQLHIQQSQTNMADGEGRKSQKGGQMAQGCFGPNGNNNAQYQP